MRRRSYFALAGWLLADLSLVLAVLGLGEAGSSTGGLGKVGVSLPGGGGDGEIDPDCVPGIDDRPLRITVDLTGLPTAAHASADDALPASFADSVRAQVVVHLVAADIVGEPAGLVQTFTDLPDEGQEVPTSFWINRALETMPELAEIGTIGMDDEDPLVDLRMRNFQGESDDFHSTIEWFPVIAC